MYFSAVESGQLEPFSGNLKSFKFWGFESSRVNEKQPEGLSKKVQGAS